MAIYALGIKNLLQPELRTRKVFFADDGVSGGMLNEVISKLTSRNRSAEIGHLAARDNP